MNYSHLILLSLIVLFGCTSQSDILQNNTQPSNTTDIADTNISNVTDITGCIDCNCVDGDNGAVASVKSTTSKGEEVKEDYCLTNTTLIEYFCAANSIQEAELPCDFCIAGHCTAKPQPGDIDTSEPVATCTGPTTPAPDIRENTTANGTVYSDSCIDFDIVKEYFCQNSTLQSINNQCDHRCNLGQCENFALSCTDSDGGRNTTLRGRVVVVNGLYTTVDKWDACVDNNILAEYYCAEDNSSVREDIPCGSGLKCSVDRCIRSKCTDSDDGLDIYTAGVTTASGVEYTDECSDDYHIKEYYCDGDVARSHIENCGPSYICSDDNNRCLEGSRP